MNRFTSLLSIALFFVILFSSGCFSDGWKNEECEFPGRIVVDVTFRDSITDEKVFDYPYECEPEHLELGQRVRPVQWGHCLEMPLDIDATIGTFVFHRIDSLPPDTIQFSYTTVSANRSGCKNDDQEVALFQVEYDSAPLIRKDFRIVSGWLNEDAFDLWVPQTIFMKIYI